MTARGKSFRGIAALEVFEQLRVLRVVDAAAGTGRIGGAKIGIGVLAAADAQRVKLARPG